MDGYGTWPASWHLQMRRLRSREAMALWRQDPHAAQPHAVINWLSPDYSWQNNMDKKNLKKIVNVNWGVKLVREGPG